MPPSDAKGRYTAAFTDAAAYDAWFTTPAGRYAAARETELLLSSVGEVSGARVLDVGCGTGRDLALWKERGARAVGLEPTKATLARAQERSAKGRVSLARGRAEALPFRDGAFDIVTMITSLEFTADAAAALREARRVCRRRLVVAVLNAWAPSGVIRRVRRNSRPTTFRHVHFFHPFALKRALVRLAPRNLTLRSTLHFFPVYTRALDTWLAVTDRWLTARRLLAGAFLIGVADFDAGGGR